MVNTRSSLKKKLVVEKLESESSDSLSDYSTTDSNYTISETTTETETETENTDIDFDTDTDSNFNDDNNNIITDQKDVQTDNSIYYKFTDAIHQGGYWIYTPFHTEIYNHVIKPILIFNGKTPFKTEVDWVQYITTFSSFRYVKEHIPSKIGTCSLCNQIRTLTVKLKKVGIEDEIECGRTCADKIEKIMAVYSIIDNTINKLSTNINNDLNHIFHTLDSIYQNFN